MFKNCKYNIQGKFLCAEKFIGSIRILGKKINKDILKNKETGDKYHISSGSGKNILKINKKQQKIYHMMPTHGRRNKRLMWEFGSEETDSAKNWWDKQRIGSDITILYK